jgi:hypothetical protein
MDCSSGESPVVLAETAVIEEFRTRLAAALNRRTEELVDAVSSAVFARVSPYQQLARPGKVEAFRADIRALLGFLVGVIAERRPLRPLELDRLRSIGAERARQGLPLDAVTDALEIGMATCWRFVREALLHAADPRAATALAADLAMETYPGLKEAGLALSAGHASEQGRGTYQRARATAELVGRILDGSWTDERDVRRAAEALGVGLHGSWLLLLVTRPHGSGGNDSGGGVVPVATAIAEAVPDALVGAPRPTPSPHVPVLLPVEGNQADPPPLATAANLALAGGALLTVSDPVSTWVALPVVYRLEAEAIPCARAAANAPGALHAADCHLYRLLQTVPQGARTEYVRRVLGPILDLSPAKTADGVATLEAYFRSRGRLDQSAADLRLHRNSYRYRWERAQSVLGVDFRYGRERLRVEMALALRRLGREEALLLDEKLQEGSRPKRQGVGDSAVD